MNLVEHYIRRIISATDISDRYEEGMKEFALLHDLAVGDGGEVDGPERHHAGVGRRLIR